MKNLFATLIAAFSLHGCSLSPKGVPVEPPNIIVIFCDDLGYADLGCYGSKLHRTPNLDRLAAEGMRFTNFYVTSGVCTPSRASLMTGSYPRRVGLHEGDGGSWVLFPGHHRGIHADEVTLPEILKTRGYATTCVGKWHLGDQPPFFPTRHGFDSYFGIPFSNDMGIWPRGEKSPYPPLPVIEGETVIEEEPDQSLLTQRYTRRVIDYIETHKDERFFIYLPHTMPHWPQASSKNFAGKSANGKWGDAVEEIDGSTGEILKTLQMLGIDDRTLVVFLSDNGGARGHDASNVPLRGAKGSTWEGGLRVPAIFRWPGKIPAGSVRNDIASSMDLLPTLARLASTEPPRDRVIDGKNIWPLLSAQPGARSPHEAIYYYFMGRLDAVRSGKWKLFTAYSGKATKRRAEGRALYNLEIDVGETTDVSAQHPDVVARLEKLLEDCREDLGDGDRPGKNTRPVGRVAEARTLTEKR